jgi:hypothetical protein
MSSSAADVGIEKRPLVQRPGFVEEGLLHSYATQRGTIKDVSTWSRVRQ